MRKLVSYLSIGVMALSLAACNGSSNAPTTTAPTTTEAPTTTAAPTTEATTTTVAETTETVDAELESIKQDILAATDYAYYGVSEDNLEILYLSDETWEFTALLMADEESDSYIGFIGSAVYDEASNIITVTDEDTGYTFGFSVESQDDGTFILDCGMLGKFSVSENSPETVVDYMVEVTNMENITKDIVEASGRMQQECIDYLNSGLVEVESTILVAYDAISGENYTDDQTMYDAVVNEILPASTELLETASAIELEFKGLQDIHDVYLTLVTTQNEAFTLLVTALEEQDTSIVEEVNTKLDEVRELTTLFQDYVERYTELTNVDYSFE